MKIYYRKIKNVRRENEEEGFEPIGPWRMAVGGSPLSMELKEKGARPLFEPEKKEMVKMQETEKRRYIRWEVPAKIYENWNIPTRVNYKIEGGSLVGEALCKDINTMGTRLSLDDELTQGTFVHLKIDLPDYPRPIFVRGEVIWHRKTGNEGKSYFEVGISFTNIKDADKRRIYTFIFDWGQDELVNLWWQGVEDIKR